MTGRKAREECQKLDVDLPFLKSEEENRDLANLVGKLENHSLEWKPLATMILNESIAHRYHWY